MAITTYNELKLAIASWLGRDEFTARIPEWIALAEDRIAQDLRVRIMETSQVVFWKATTDGGTVAGTANAITLSGLVGAPALGNKYSFTAALSNTGATTINAAYSVKKRYGGVKEALGAGDIVIGGDYWVYFDGADFLLVPPGAAPLPTNFLQQRRLYLDVSTTKTLEYFDPSVFWTRNAVNETSQPSAYTVEGDFIVAAPVPDATYYGRLLYYRRLASLSAATDTNWILTNARGLYLYGSLLEAYTLLEDDAGQLKYSVLYEDTLKRVHDADKRARFPMGAISSRSQVPVI